MKILKKLLKDGILQAFVFNYICIMQKATTKGINFIGRRKAIVDLARHGDIMEDAIDRIKVKEAMNTGQFIDWEEAKESLNHKHGINGLPNSNRKKSAKVPRKRS